MLNTSTNQQKLLYVAIALSLMSVFFILNTQSSYSQTPEISFLDVNDTSSVSKFSVAAWFKTSANYKSDAFIVNKPGSSNYMNYGIWMTASEKVRGGFETSDGKAVYATSPLSYSDGKWHYVVVTFDGSILNLYVDGVYVDTKKTSASPDNGGDNPLRVGADSGTVGDYFDGDVDEIRVYRVAWTPEEVSDAYHNTFDTKYQEVYLDFSDPIMIVNASLPINQTALNQTALNQTALNQTALNQTALNQTALNQTALNQTALNLTVIEGFNDTASTNETSTQTNGTLLNETGTVPEPSTENDTGTSNETLNNIPPVQETPNVNDTGITNETQDNQTGPLLTEENNSPEALDQSVSVHKGSQLEITLRATDEDNDPLKFDVTVDPVQGTLDNFDTEKGTAIYVPQQGYSGNDQFRFRAIDDKGFESNVAEVDITVNEESQSNETQASDLTEPPQDTTNETSTEQDTGTSALEQPNQPPNANAGNDLNVEINTKVNLDGSQSTDEDGEIVSYKWEQTGGPEIDLKQSDAQTASFDVPESAADSTLKFKLTVVDDKDGSDSDEVTVEVESVVNNQAQQTDTDTDTNQQNDTDTETNQQTETDTNTNQQTDSNTNQQTETQQLEQNISPNADAGGDQNVEVNDQVKLDGSKSSDEDGQIVSYKWEQTGGPEIDLKQSDAQTASFDVPESAAGSALTFELTVVDDKGASNSDDVTVEVKNVENQPPKADAGGDKNAEVNAEVKLDGGNSADEDGEIVSYKWEQTDGPKVDLKNPDEQTASFDVPESAADSKLSFELSVVDDKDASDSDDTTVEIQSVPQESDEESEANGGPDPKGKSD
jgi:Concanavalin A-like lectin/glucanases superfamily/K319L-like, PKD domain/Bacterial Ig domain